jgi:hypothetical protein
LTLIEGHERDRLVQLAPQVQAARELNGVAGTQWGWCKSSARASAVIFRDQCDKRESRHVALESHQCAVATRRRERAFTRPTNVSF